MRVRSIRVLLYLEGIINKVCTLKVFKFCFFISGQNINQHEQHGDQGQGQGHGQVGNVDLVNQQVIQNKDDARRQEEIRRNKIIQDIAGDGGLVGSYVSYRILGNFRFV